MAETKPFGISKRAVWEAYRRVKENRGAAGVDHQSLEDLDKIYQTICTSSGIGWPRGVTSRRPC